MENFRIDDYDTLIVLGALIIWHIRLSGGIIVLSRTKYDWL